MQVLHVMHAYYPAMGGTERVVQKVAEQMVAGHDDGVTVYTTTAYNCELFWRNDQKRMQPGWETINGVRVRRFPVYNGMARLRWLVGNGSYVLHLPYSDWARALYNGPIVPGLADAIAGAPADVVVASPFPLLHMHTAQRSGEALAPPVRLPVGRDPRRRRLGFQPAQHLPGSRHGRPLHRDHGVRARVPDRARAGWEEDRRGQSRDRCRSVHGGRRLSAAPPVGVG